MFWSRDHFQGGGGGVHVHGSIKFVLLRVFCGGRPHPDADMYCTVYANILSILII